MPSRKDLANAIRALSMDAIQQASSGHPGAPMGMADIAEVLWNTFLSHNPLDPSWANRDRFVLSNGHASMLLYSLLHLSGYDLSIEDIKAFRQQHAKTPGHPEYRITPGVETTTGPLGQGLANAVGMAMAERNLAAKFNRDGYDLINHFTYAFLGDGCMMEGLSHEVCSLAGTWGLGKLIAFWDDNGISIDGQVQGWFTDDTAKRFEAYGWHVIREVDGHAPQVIKQALNDAKSVTDKPTLICCKTVIGFGAPTLGGSHKCHGSPLGDNEIAAARENLDWPYKPFLVPDEIYAEWDARTRGKTAQATWDKQFLEYKTAHPTMAADLLRQLNGELPSDWNARSNDAIRNIAEKAESYATRKASQNTLNIFGADLPELIGGSADLTGSNLTAWSGSTAINETMHGGNYINYGVREFGMAAIMNGIALHGGLIPYGGTFMVFSDYARNAIRMAALMGLRAIYVLTHDSIGLGEDGPTHQPIEHLASLRIIPNMAVWRPCDAVETAVAWKMAIERTEGPTCLVLSRQKLAHQSRTASMLANIQRGGYILADSDTPPAAIIIATGSEVPLAMAAREKLIAAGKSIRVVSIPALDQFQRQDKEYRESVLPTGIGKRVIVEAGVTSGWYQYAGVGGKIIGLDQFGESAPASKLFEHFGFTVDNVVQTVESIIGS